jgi:hypothetical protein
LRLGQTGGRKFFEERQPDAPITVNPGDAGEFRSPEDADVELIARADAITEIAGGTRRGQDRNHRRRRGWRSRLRSRRRRSLSRGLRWILPWVLRLRVERNVKKQDQTRSEQRKRFPQHVYSTSPLTSPKTIQRASLLHYCFQQPGSHTCLHRKRDGGLKAMANSIRLWPIQNSPVMFVVNSFIQRRLHSGRVSPNLLMTVNLVVRRQIG